MFIARFLLPLFLALTALAVVATPLAGLFMYLGGTSMLFAYIGGLAGLFILYTLKRNVTNRRPPEGLAMPFRLLTRTGILALFMDPRNSDGAV